MRGRVLATVAVVAVAAGASAIWWWNAGSQDEHFVVPPGPSLMKGLGDWTHPIQTRSTMAQKWFDQGLVLMYASNREAASAAFLRATEFDPGCAMCWWGAALVLGPTVDAGMDPVNVPLAWERLRKAHEALEASPEPSKAETAWIEALDRRYAQSPPTDRRALDLAWSKALRELISHYPQDLDARTLFAESIMNLHPWDYHDAQANPRPWTPEIVIVLEKVIAEEPAHPGANALYVQVVEASATPERGLDAARRLEHIAPAAGHLQHLSSPIWYRVGRYHDASEANLRAVAADKAWLASNPADPGLYARGYVPHHQYFLAASAMMEGAETRALTAAAAVANLTDLDQARLPGFEALQHFWIAPYFVGLRFGRWDEMLAEPPPPADLAYPLAMWHFVRGVSLVQQGQAAEAERELGALVQLSADPSLADATIFERNRQADLLRIAASMLAGEIAAQRKDWATAIASLSAAVAGTDALRYDEPPVWPVPLRPFLAAVLMDAGRFVEAQEVLEQDLVRYPENPWALSGLASALQFQGRGNDASAARARFSKAWQFADRPIEGVSDFFN